MTIGLIAHDAKKKLMQNFCIAYRGILSKHTVCNRHHRKTDRGGCQLKYP